MPCHNGISERHCTKHFHGFRYRASTRQYYSRFQQFRKSFLNPVVVLDRLPENLLRIGGIEKSIPGDVKTERTQINSLRSDKSAAKDQPLDYGSHKVEKNLKGRKKRAFAAEEVQVQNTEKSESLHQKAIDFKHAQKSKFAGNLKPTTITSNGYAIRKECPCQPRMKVFQARQPTLRCLPPIEVFEGKKGPRLTRRATKSQSYHGDHIKPYSLDSTLPEKSTVHVEFQPLLNVGSWSGKKDCGCQHKCKNVRGRFTSGYCEASLKTHPSGVEEEHSATTRITTRHSTKSKIQPHSKDRLSKRSRNKTEQSDKAVVDLAAHPKTSQHGKTVRNTPPSMDAGEKVIVKTQQGYIPTLSSSNSDILPGSKVGDPEEPGRGHAKSNENVEYTLGDYFSPQESEEGRELRSSCSNVGNDSYTAVGNFVQSPVEPVTVEKKKGVEVQCLTKSKNMRGSKIRLPIKRTVSRLNSESPDLVDKGYLIKVGSPQKYQKEHKHSSPSFKIDCNFVGKTSDEVTSIEDECQTKHRLNCQMLLEEKIGVVTNGTAVRDSGDTVLQKLLEREVLGKEDWSEAQCFAKSEIHYGTSEKCDQAFPKHSIESGEKGESKLAKFESQLVKIESQLFKIESPLKCSSKLFLPCGVVKRHSLNTGDLVQQAPDEVTMDKEKTFLAQSLTEPQIPPFKIHSPTKGCPDRSASSEDKAQLISVQFSNLQRLKEGSELKSSSDEINFDEKGGGTDGYGGLVERILGDVIPTGKQEMQIEQDQSLPKCKIGLENDFKTKHTFFGVGPSGKATMKIDPNCKASVDKCCCSTTSGGDAVQNYSKELIVEDQKCFRALSSLESKIPIPFGKKEEHIQAHCSGKPSMKLNGTEGGASGNQLDTSTSKSLQKEPEDDLRIDRIGKVCSSEACHWKKTWTSLTNAASIFMDPKKSQDDVSNEIGMMSCSLEECPWKRAFEMLKPSIIKLKRVSGTEKVLKPAAVDDGVRYPVDVKAGSRKVERMFQRLNPSTPSPVISKLPEKKIASNVEGVTRLDLSDRLALKKFCEMKSICLDSDVEDDDGNGNVMQHCIPSPVVSRIPEDFVDCADDAPSCLVENRSPSLIIAPSHTHSDSNMDLLHSAPTDGGPNLLVDAEVSENPFPSSAQALNELSFLDNESLRKEDPSEKIWSDVLDCSESDDPEVNEVSSPEVGDLMPSFSRDAHLFSDSEEQIEVRPPAKVIISTGLDRNGLETIEITPKMLEDCLRGSHSDKEHLMKDPLTSYDYTEEPNFAISKSSQWDSVTIHPKKIALGVSHQQDGEGKTEKWGMEGFRKMPYIADIGSALGHDLPISVSETLNSTSRKPESLDHDSKNDDGGVSETDPDLRALKYRTGLIRRTRKINVGRDKNDGNVDKEAERRGIKISNTKDVPTIEKLYHNLSTIPYIVKCNLQNRNRYCKNLNPCANANRNFQLFWTLTVGVGRRLSKPLMESLQTPEDTCIINRTTAYVAASAVSSRCTTILVPALPEAVRKILPIHYSKLLEHLVTETIEKDKMLKRSNSDKAIAEILEFKRALIAQKARFPIEGNRGPPKPKRSKPTSHIAQVVYLGRQFHKSNNRIVAVKSKTDSKYKFVRKKLVSILPKELNKRVNKTEEATDNKESDDHTQKKFSYMSQTSGRLPELEEAPPEKQLKLLHERGRNFDCSTIPANFGNFPCFEPSNDVNVAQSMPSKFCDYPPNSLANYQTNVPCRSAPIRSSSFTGYHNNSESSEPPAKKHMLEYATAHKGVDCVGLLGTEKVGDPQNVNSSKHDDQLTEKIDDFPAISSSYTCIEHYVGGEGSGPDSAEKETYHFEPGLCKFSASCI